MQPSVGQWLASAGLDDDPLAVGVVSVPRRAIPPIGGVMGILLSEKDGAARIEKIIPKCPAEVAGIKTDDIITHVNGENIANVVQLPRHSAKTPSRRNRHAHHQTRRANSQHHAPTEASPPGPECSSKSHE